MTLAQTVPARERLYGELAPPCCRGIHAGNARTK